MPMLSGPKAPCPSFIGLRLLRPVPRGSRAPLPRYVFLSSQIDPGRRTSYAARPLAHVDVPVALHAYLDQSVGPG